MEKEFVLYKQALEIKELGFDEPCFGMYCEGVFYKLYPNMGNYIPDDVYREVDCPTFSQVFRWFREKYNLHHWIGHYCSQYDRKWGYNWNIQDSNKDNYYSSKPDAPYGEWEYETYEEAELACLIKLIEIVKSK